MMHENQEQQQNTNTTQQDEKKQIIQIETDLNLNSNMVNQENEESKKDISQIKADLISMKGKNELSLPPEKKRLEKQSNNPLCNIKYPMRDERSTSVNDINVILIKLDSIITSTKKDQNTLLEKKNVNYVGSTSIPDIKSLYNMIIGYANIHNKNSKMRLETYSDNYKQVDGIQLEDQYLQTIINTACDFSKNVNQAVLRKHPCTPSSGDDVIDVTVKYNVSNINSEVLKNIIKISDSNGLESNMITELSITGKMENMQEKISVDKLLCIYDESLKILKTLKTNLGYYCDHIKTLNNEYRASKKNRDQMLFG